MVPLAGGGGNAGIVTEGDVVESGKEPRATFFATTAHAVDTLGQTLVSGRDFTETEAATRWVRPSSTRRWPAASGPAVPTSSAAASGLPPIHPTSGSRSSASCLIFSRRSCATRRLPNRLRFFRFHTRPCATAASLSASPVFLRLRLRRRSGTQWAIRRHACRLQRPHR